MGLAALATMASTTVTVITSFASTLATAAAAILSTSCRRCPEARGALAQKESTMVSASAPWDPSTVPTLTPAMPCEASCRLRLRACAA